MVDVDEERLALSRKFGVAPRIQRRRQSTDARGRPSVRDGLGADVVVEACGVPSVIGQSLALLRRGGTLFEIGHLANVGLAEIDPHAVCRNELSILGHYAYPTSQTLAYAATLLAARAFPYEALLQCIPLDDYAAVLDDTRRLGPVKLVFVI